MSRTFRTVGSGASQTTEPIENNKIPVYETKAAAEADIANLSDGQIIATKDEGNENAKPVDVVEKGNMHAVTSNAVADTISYSTNEVKTGGKWIDGKPIYRKTIDCGALPNNTSKTVAHGISNLEKAIMVSGFAINNNWEFIYIPHALYGFYINKTNIVMNTTFDYSSYTETYITIEYTKTTD